MLEALRNNDKYDCFDGIL